MGSDAQGGGRQHYLAMGHVVCGALAKSAETQAHGTLGLLDQGHSQGGPISPFIANIFLHYGFDLDLTRSSRGCAVRAVDTMWWSIA